MSEITHFKAENAELKAENAKLRELVANMMPSDSEGRALDIADTVHMLRSEYDGDHEWDDVVVELAWTKWGGDRWIVRGSKGEAWACECTKTGYDEDAYEASDDVEPFDKPTLLEVENAKLRELVQDMYGVMWACAEQRCTHRHDGCFRVHGNHGDICVSERCWYEDRMSELGIEV